MEERKQKKKILIIDDDSQLQEIYQNKLSAEGFEVYTASTGKDGLMLVRTHQPDLIILDIMLPGGWNGFDVLEQLRRDEKLKNIPIFVLTNLEEEGKTAKSIGISDYIVKTDTSIENIIQKIKKTLT